MSLVCPTIGQATLSNPNDDFGLILVVFSLLQKSASDVSNFDTDFTMEKPQLTQTDKDLLRTMDQTVFEGFSFTNQSMSK